MKCTGCGSHLKPSAWAVCYVDHGTNAPIHIMSLKELEEASVYAKPAFKYRLACSLRCTAVVIRKIRAGEPANV